MPTQQQQTDSPRKSYDAFADKVGMVPNVRFKDNLIQGIVVAVFTLIGALGGYFVSPDLSGAGYGALSGLIGGGFLSGFVLMIVGLNRKA